MSLITCPQDGCDQQVSLSARACPNCGFAVCDFFLEDLRGFDTNKAMRRFDHWVDNKDGTITDIRSKLTWLRAPYGLEWSGKFFCGEAIELDWSDATARFGKGNVVGYTNDRLDQGRLQREGTFANGYVKGSEALYFGGRRGWRLPTISEYMTLNELMETADGFIDDGKHYYYFFDVVFSRGSLFLITASRKQHRLMHSATYLNEALLFGKKTFFGKKLRGGTVWAYMLLERMGMDISAENKYPFLLVSE